MDDQPGVILITGASRGIGRHLCEHYLEAGWTVHGVSRQPTPPPSGDAYTHHAVDVADERTVVAMMAAIRRTGQPLYALLNNAGAAAMNHALTTPVASMERLLRTNAVGTMLMSREGAKLMLGRGVGRIVNFVSRAIAWNLEGESAYVAAKAAVDAYTRVLARELGPRGITVNAVAPNPVETDLLAGVPRERIEGVVSRQAIPRLGTPADVARVVDFFLDPASDFVTGQTIHLGGP